MENRRAQLQELLARLDALLATLAADPSCQWLRHFVSCRQQAHELLELGCTQSELNEFSGSVNSVYGGSGSLNDYVGTSESAEHSSRVYESALALRVLSNAT